ncbi:MAG: ATP-binding protein, partial [Blautia sp.]|nr:ATP-binding protein [Blautia sp.]
NECVEMVLRRLRPIADQRSISLFLDSFRPVEADLDEIKFTSALMNLVENAIKYNVDDGWVRVTINADHQFLFLIVADSGMGIPEEAKELIFERFYRVDKSHSQEIGGTGLGLAIVRSVVQAHQGTIQLKSKEGEGSSFALKIPLTYIPPGGVALKGGEGKER